MTSEKYFEDTIFLKKESFLRKLNIKKEAKKENKADFAILHINNSSSNYRELSAAVEKCIRGTDFAGILQDNQAYVVLSNSSAKDSINVLKRLKVNGIEAEALSGDDIYA